MISLEKKKHSFQESGVQIWSLEFNSVFLKETIRGFPKMVVPYPTPIGFPTKNDHFGVWNGGTTILGNTHIILGKVGSWFKFHNSQEDHAAVSDPPHDMSVDSNHVDFQGSLYHQPKQ